MNALTLWAIRTEQRAPAAGRERSACGRERLRLSQTTSTLPVMLENVCIYIYTNVRFIVCCRWRLRAKYFRLPRSGCAWVQFSSASRRFLRANQDSGVWWLLSYPCARPSLIRPVDKTNKSTNTAGTRGFPDERGRIPTFDDNVGEEKEQIVSV